MKKRNVNIVARYSKLVAQISRGAVKDFVAGLALIKQGSQKEERTIEALGYIKLKQGDVEQSIVIVEELE